MKLFGLVIVAIALGGTSALTARITASAREADPWKAISSGMSSKFGDNWSDKIKTSAVTNRVEWEQIRKTYVLLANTYKAYPQ
jgi:hypothetical protein